MFPHHDYEMFAIVFVFLLVRSCLLITLIKCLKGHKSLMSLCNVKIKSHSLSQSLLLLPYKEQSQTLATIETFDQSDEETIFGDNF